MEFAKCALRSSCARQLARHLILERNFSSFGIHKMSSPFQPSRQLARHLILERNFSSFGIREMRSPFQLCPSRFWSGFSLFYLHCNENSMYVFLEKKLRGFSTNFHIHVSVSDLYILRIGPHIFLQQNRQTDGGNI